METKPFPPGVRFCPSDEELIVPYLQQRAKKGLRFPDLVVDHDIYKCEPWELPSHYFKDGNVETRNGEMFFFTPRRRVSTGPREGMSRVNVRRTAGEGSWESSGLTIDICNDKGVIGRRTAFVFKRKNVTEAAAKTDWIMQEYLLPSAANEFQKLALCKIYYKGKEDINNWEGPAKIKKRTLTNEPPGTCAAKFSASSDVAGPSSGTVFNHPEINNCDTQCEASDNQFLSLKAKKQRVQLVTREEEVKEQSVAAVTDQQLLTELASFNLEEEIVTPAASRLDFASSDTSYNPDISSPLNADNNFFESLDDALDLQDNGIWVCSYWEFNLEEEIVTPAASRLDFASSDTSYNPDISSPLNADNNFFESLDDALDLQDNGIWDCSYWDEMHSCTKQSIMK